jgi:hypothetical protein
VSFHTRKSFNRHAFPNYADGVLEEARVLLLFLRLALEPVTDLANAPIVAFNSLCDQPLGNQLQLALFGGFIDGERGFEVL